VKHAKNVMNFVKRKGNGVYWSEQMELQIQSHLSRVAYCESAGISYQQFIYWEKKLKKKIGSPLIPVRLENKHDNEPFELSKVLCRLTLKNGQSIQIYDEEALLLILKKVV